MKDMERMFLKVSRKLQVLINILELILEKEELWSLECQYQLNNFIMEPILGQNTNLNKLVQNV